MTRFQNDNLSALNLRKLNLRHFCRDALDLQRDLALEDLPRVKEGLSAATHNFVFQAQGSTLTQPSGATQLQLKLNVQGSAPLVCQRCLERVDVPVNSQARFVLVANEAEADAMEAETEELAQEGQLSLAPDAREIEPLVADKPLDLIALVEDEILLSLPLVPMHEVCPQPLAALSPKGIEIEAELDAKKPNPFAVLASLKKH